MLDLNWCKMIMRGVKMEKKEIVSDISSMFKNIKIESETSPHHCE